MRPDMGHPAAQQPSEAEMVEARMGHVESRAVVRVELVEIHNPRPDFDDDAPKRIRIVCRQLNVANLASWSPGITKPDGPDAVKFVRVDDGVCQAAPSQLSTD
jgi:hypothetical protein